MTRILIGFTFFIVWGWQIERHDFLTRDGCEAARYAIAETKALKSSPAITPCIKDVPKP